jgi:hypothetical protein
VWDEVSSCTKGIKPKDAWEGVIQPCIVTRWSKKRAKALKAIAGRALIIGTPKGFNFFQEMSTFCETDDEWSFYHYDYRDSPFLDEDEINRIKNTLDPVQFASEYGALFKESGNSVFYCFDRKVHIKHDLVDFFKGDDSLPPEDVHCNIDFNVGLQCTSIYALRGKQMQYLDEMQGHPDTDTLAKALVKKYEGHQIHAYPDPSGNSRKTSAPVGVTDFTILRSYGIHVHARPAAPPIVDSANAVNRQLLTAADTVNMYFHPRVKGTILSMERTVWSENNTDSAIISKKEGVEHYSDGIRYGTEWHFPVKNGRVSAVKSKSF